MTLENTVCGECVFFKNYECRRFPPVAFAVLVDNQAWRHEHMFVYPNVGFDFPCCGEFKLAKG